MDSNNNGFRLHEGESIIIDVTPSPWWTLGKYVITLGAWEIWRRQHRYVLTNERVMFRKGIISKTEQSAPLSRVQDAAVNVSPLTGGRVALSTAGGSLGEFSVIDRVTQADARAFADALTPLLGQGSTGV